MKIELGKYIEQGVDWLSANAGGFFDDGRGT